MLHTWTADHFHMLHQSHASSLSLSLVHGLPTFATQIWVTLTAPGCGFKPLEVPLNSAFWAHHPPPVFNWMEVAARNEYARGIFTARGAHFLDMHSPLERRVDSHPAIWEACMPRRQCGSATFQNSVNMTFAHAPTESLTSRIGGGYSGANDCLHQCELGPLQTVGLDFLLLFLQDLFQGKQGGSKKGTYDSMARS